MNKIDLIFEKQPPQVQRKLMNLLLSYNAMMQYNKNQDKFEVDLLLPFKNQQQKQQFIQNYQSRSSRSVEKSKRSHQSGSIVRNRKQRQQQQIDYIMKKQQKQMFSTHKAQRNTNDIHRKQNQPTTKKKYHSHNNQNNYNDDIIHQYEGSIGESMSPDSAEISYNFTNDNDNQSSIRRKTISLKDISSIIKNKIRGAIEEISQQKQQQKKRNQVINNFNHKNNQNNGQGQYGRISEYQDQTQYQKNHNEQQVQQNSLKLNRIQMQQQNGHENIHNHGMIMNQLDHPLQTQKDDNRNKNFKSSQVWNRTYEKGKQLPHNSTQRSRSSNQSSEIKNQMLIQDIHEDQLFQASQQNQKHFSNQNNHMFISEQNQDQLFLPQKNIEINQNNKINKKHVSKNLFSSNSNEINTGIVHEKYKDYNKNPVQPSRSGRKSAYIPEDKQVRKINSSYVRQRYSDFMKKNNRDFQRIYDTIRRQIKRNQSKIQKTKRQDPILVLEENINEAYSEQDKIFKQEIIKDYQKYIIAENQNMSSEDLVRYFRYLLQNAKSLYIKHIRKGK